MKYVKLFKTTSELDNGVKVDTPNVSYLREKNVLLIPKSVGDEVTVVYKQEDNEIHYELPVPAVKFTANAENSTITLSAISNYQTLEYSMDGNNWSNMTTGTTITLVNSGERVYVRGVLSNNNTDSNITRFKMSGNIKASGNINYLWNKDNPNAALKQYCGYMLFGSCTALTDASELELPATTLANSCYSYIFWNCSGLTSAPELPATTLSDYCYQWMFSNCTSLTTAPVLPATTLTEGCYYGIFNGCRSLTTAPVLPATALTKYCYYSMFSNCSGLTSAPELPATTLANNCYEGMFTNTRITSAPELPATNLARSCYKTMFRGCTSLTTAPALPATTLEQSCYSDMFRDCTSLTTAPELPATTLAHGCYSYMFSGCTNLNYIKCLATTTAATDCLKNWVDNVASSGTFVKDASMSSWTTGVNGIPTNWTVEDAV